MALVFKDRVKETTTTTGTGTVNLDGAETGFQSFVAAIGNTNTCHYAITDGTSWEVGLGTVTDAATDTLSRDTVYDSSNAGSLVNFAAGTKDVFCSASAYNATNPTVTGNLTVEGTFTSVGIDDNATTKAITIDSSERVGVNTTSPDNTFHVQKASAGTVTGHVNGVITLENDVQCYMQFLSPNNRAQGLYFGDPEAVDVGTLLYNHSQNVMTFTVNGSEAARFDSSGSLSLVSDTLNVQTQATPTSATAAGTKGDIVHDTNYIYVCTATNVWKRTALTTW